MMCACSCVVVPALQSAMSSTTPPIGSSTVQSVVTGHTYFKCVYLRLQKTEQVRA